MSAKTDEIIRIMKDEFFVFRGVSEKSLRESLQVFRMFELREGETLKICGSDLGDDLYVVIGEVEAISPDGGKTILTPQSSKIRPVILPSYPKTLTIVAREDSFVCHVEVALLDYLLIMEGILNNLEGASIARHVEVAHKSSVFQHIPLALAEAAFKNFKEIAVKTGQEIITSDSQSDAFYIIISGSAEVWSLGLESGEMEQTGTLGAGDEFGAESLITGKKSSSTVRMNRDGVLLSLGKEDFKKLLARPLVKEVEPPVANAMLGSGYKALDVRLIEEYEMGHIEGALPIPLHEIKKRASELDRDARYVAYCRSGNRSSVAVFMLNELGFDTVSLKGGISKWTYGISE
jgi:rhodanese-related sulfurtransferase